MEGGSRFASLINDENESLVQPMDLSSSSSTMVDSLSIGIIKDKCERSPNKTLLKSSSPWSASPPRTKVLIREEGARINEPER